MKIYGSNIGKILKEAREIKKMTQEELADKVGKKRAYITRIETEQGNKINLHTLREIVEKGLDGELNIDLKL